LQVAPQRDGVVILCYVTTEIDYRHRDCVGMDSVGILSEPESI